MSDRSDKIIVPIPVESGLYRRYIRMEWVFDGGQVIDCMIAFEIEVDERVYQVIRYDNSHGSEFHRHKPDFPEPADEKTDLSQIPQNERLAYARDEILRNYREWETIVLSNVVLDIEDSE